MGPAVQMHYSLRGLPLRVGTKIVSLSFAALPSLYIHLHVQVLVPTQGSFSEVDAGCWVKGMCIWNVDRYCQVALNKQCHVCLHVSSSSSILSNILIFINLMGKNGSFLDLCVLSQVITTHSHMFKTFISFPFFSIVFLSDS